MLPCSLKTYLGSRLVVTILKTYYEYDTFGCGHMLRIDSALLSVSGAASAEEAAVKAASAPRSGCDLDGRFWSGYNSAADAEQVVDHRDKNMNCLGAKPGDTEYNKHFKDLKKCQRLLDSTIVIFMSKKDGRTRRKGL